MNQEKKISEITKILPSVVFAERIIQKHHDHKYLTMYRLLRIEQQLPKKDVRDIYRILNS